MAFSETFAESWMLRYGSAPPAGAEEALTPFLRHRSVRKFSEREVPEALVSSLMAAAQSASTSSNLQLWSAVSVQDPERRLRIAELCAAQKQVQTAPWFLCFLADHYRVRRAAAAYGEACAGLDWAEFALMAAIDAALAAERFATAAEYLGLGVCYIGALRNDPAAVREFLGLPEGTFGVYGLCLGWPADGLDAKIKPRLAQPAVWHRERYDLEPDTDEYDRRMKAFYESEGMKGDHTWSARSGRRLDNNHLTGREAILDFLHAQGMLRR